MLSTPGGFRFGGTQFWCVVAAVSIHLYTKEPNKRQWNTPRRLLKCCESENAAPLATFFTTFCHFPNSSNLEGTKAPKRVPSSFYRSLLCETKRCQDSRRSYFKINPWPRFLVAIIERRRALTKYILTEDGRCSCIQAARKWSAALKQSPELQR